ncbi:MAG: ATP-binding cassette domain-containing protein [Candidatus Nezhaarchaeales archaeon]
MGPGGGLRGEAVSLRDAAVAYSGFGRPAICGVTLSIGLGRYVVVTGPNGAGKTTLIEACLGLLKPVRGSVKLLGVDTRSRGLARVRRLCGYVPQGFMRPPHDHYTARQVISMGLAPLGRGGSEGVGEVAEALGIKPLLERPVGTLSGGEQQKVFIARAMVRRPLVLFLDEPFASLDRASREAVAHALGDYVKRAGASVVVVTHDTMPVSSLADAVVKMEGGRVVSVEGL